MYLSICSIKATIGAVILSPLMSNPKSNHMIASVLDPFICSLTWLQAPPMSNQGNFYPHASIGIKITISLSRIFPVEFKIWVKSSNCYNQPTQWIRIVREIYLIITRLTSDHKAKSTNNI